MIKHKRTGTKAHRVCRNLIARCYNPNNKSYKDYGARGIKVCEEWKNPLAFFQWYDRYLLTEELELDRIDNNSDYCPQNCRFVSRKINSRNRRSNIQVWFDGKYRCAKEVWEICAPKVTYIKFLWRIKQGWNLDKALSSEDFRFVSA